MNVPPAVAETLTLFSENTSCDALGELQIAGCGVTELAQRFGTPLYIFDELALRHRCHAFRAALDRHYPGEAAVAYAGKAYLNVALAQLFATEGLWLDAVSGGEMYVAQTAGFPPERVTFHGNNKTEAELRQALCWGVGRIAVDNFDELCLLSQMASQPLSLWLRLAPGVDAHTHAYIRTGLVDSKFGLTIPTGDAERALRFAAEDPHLRVAGIHAHIGSQILDSAPFAATIETLLAFAAEMRDRYGFRLQELSPGGGLGVRYTPQDPLLPIETFVQRVAETVAATCEKVGLPLPRLVLEPGRAIVGPTAVALYTVGARKEIPGVRSYVAVDGGMADNIRPALYQARYAVVAATKLHELHDRQITIAGRFCESGDILIRDAWLPPLEPGDLLALPTAGAYCLAMASNYNQVPRPAVVMVRDGQAQLIQRRETYDDLVQRDLPLNTTV